MWWVVYENLKKSLSKVLLQSGLPAETATPVHQLAGESSSSSGSFWGLQKDGYQTIRQSLPHMVAGFVAGGTAALVSNPLDVVKTRLQTAQVSKAGGALGFLKGMQRLLAEEGIRGAFFRGIVPKLVTTAPLGMISSVMYEGILYMSRKQPGASDTEPLVKKEK